MPLEEPTTTIARGDARPKPAARPYIAALGWIAVLATAASLIAGVVGLEHAIRTREDVGAGIRVPVTALLVGLAVMLGPAGLAKLEALWRYTQHLRAGVHRATGRDNAATIVPSDPWRARLLQDTRVIVRDMDHLASHAAWWPGDRGRRWGRVQRWWASRAARSFADFTQVNQITRDVWDWLRTVEALSESQRRDLADRGVDVERLRKTLLADHDFHERFVAIVHRLRMYERALVAGPTDPFRGNVQHRGTNRPHPSVFPRHNSGVGERESETLRSDYERVIAVYGPALRRKAARYARSTADIEDLYQDMLVAIWRALPQFKGLSSLGTYVHRIAYSTAVDYIRKYRDVGPEIELEAEGCDPEARLVELRTRERVREEVARLPERLRDVLVLWLEGHDYAAIADGVGIHESNVGVRLTRARARLRRRLAKA